MTETKLRLLFRYLLAIAIAIGLLALFNLHWQVINSPVVLDVFEGVQPHFSALLAAGGNPYTAEHQPLYTNAYPPLYNALCALLLGLTDNSLAMHRAVSGLFIGLSCAVVFVAGLHARLGVLYAAMAAVLLYAGLQYYSTVVASPNSLGTFFFLLSVLLPWRFQFSNASLLASIICVSLAFFSKQYFALGLPIIALYCLLYISVKRAFAYGLLASMLLLGAILVMDHIGPFFLENTIFAMGNVAHAADSGAMVFKQLSYFSKYYGLLILAGLISLALPKESQGSLNKDESTGLLPGHPPNYFLFAFVLSTTAVALVLGRNGGNYMTYLFQLMSPFFILWLLQLFSNRPRAIFMAPLLAANIGVAYAALPKQTIPDMSSWERIYHHIDQHQLILNSATLSYAVMSRGKPVQIGGLDSMFNFATMADTPLQSSERRLAAVAVFDKYRTNIRDSVIAQRYDALMVLPGGINHLIIHDKVRKKGDGSKFLRQYYRLHERIPFSLTERRGGGEYELQVWLPKNAPLDAQQ